MRGLQGPVGILATKTRPERLGRRLFLCAAWHGSARSDVEFPIAAHQPFAMLSLPASVICVFGQEEDDPAAKRAKALDPVQQMLEASKKLAQQRAAALRKLQPPAAPAAPPPGAAAASGADYQNLQASVQARLAALKAQVNARTAGGLPGMPQGSVAATGLPHSLLYGSVQPKDRPKPLLLDDKGRMVDAAGKEIQMARFTPEFKANVRAKDDKAAGAAALAVGVAATPEEELEAAPYYDERLGLPTQRRSKRMFRFNEPGRFQELADKQRAQAQLERLQEEISTSAKKMGISSATKLALMAPKKGAESFDVPDIEWWDQSILPNQVRALAHGPFNCLTLSERRSEREKRRERKRERDYEE